MWLQNQRQPQRKSRRRKSHEKDENESTCPVFSMTLTVSALAGNGRLTIQAATSQESSGTKETTEKDSTTSADTAENKNQIIKIADEKAFEEFLQNCQYDSWSVGKTVKLTHNIDLSKVDFNGVAYFSGDFEGGGHTISNVKLQVKGSDHGFFRYLGKSAVVNDLKISGKITSEGSCKNIGGIAGVNYGTIGTVPLKELSMEKQQSERSQGSTNRPEKL